MNTPFQHCNQGFRIARKTRFNVISKPLIQSLFIPSCILSFLLPSLPTPDTTTTLAVGLPVVHAERGGLLRLGVLE